MSNGTGRVPIIACTRDAWLFLVRNWRLFLPAAAIVAVITELGPAISLLTSAGQPAATPTNLFAVMLPAILAGLMFSGAILRKAVRDEYKPPVGLTLGADEGRLFAVNLCVMLICIPIVMLLSVVLMATALRGLASSPEALEALAADSDALAAAVAQALGPIGALLLATIMVVLFALALGLTALANAATIGERKIVVAQSWRWMGGNFFRVLLAMVLTVVPVLIINTVISQLLLSVLVSMSGEAVDTTAYLLVSVVITFLNVLVAMPITALGAVLYKGLRPADFVAK